jgi:hypothetical protein
MKDPIYFAANYIKVIAPSRGLVSYKPYPYQKKIIKQMRDNRFNIILACRQSGKSISTIVFILWYAIFHPEKNIAILANKGATAREMLSRITLALENLPFFLQPGCKALNKGNITFANNTKIIASATSGSSIRGLSIDCVTGDTKVTICNDNGEIYHAKISDLINENKATGKILTQDGFKDFDGFIERDKSKLLKLIFDNESELECTYNHKLLCFDGKYREASTLSRGDVLYPDTKIIDIIQLEEEKNVYDALNVKDTHSYITNDVVSHNCLFLDEFAFVENANEFYTSTYPVISAGDETKVIITSTANGVGNLFHKLYEGAVQKRNEYAPFRIDWWDVPGRDEAWKKQTIANTSELQFAQEYGNDFMGRSNTLISSDAILGMISEDPEEHKNNISYYEKPKEGVTYVMTVDVSKGRGQDYSTFSVFKVERNKFKQVCVFRDNMISPMIYPDIIVRVARLYNEAVVLIENNDVGQVVCNAVYYDYEYENTFVQSTIKAGGVGVTMTKRIKRIGCSNMKDLIEQKKLEIVDSDTINEISTFEAKGASYEASGGNHDDLVMNLVLFSWFISSDAFGEILDMDLKSMLYEDRIREIEDDLIPFGFIEDGVQDNSNKKYEEIVQQQKDWMNI